MRAASAMNIAPIMMKIEREFIHHIVYADETPMFGFVSSQISMKLHQYLDRFDILLTKPLFKIFLFCAINNNLIPMKMKPQLIKDMWMGILCSDLLKN